MILKFAITVQKLKPNYFGWARVDVACEEALAQNI